MRGRMNRLLCRMSSVELSNGFRHLPEFAALMRRQEGVIARVAGRWRNQCAASCFETWFEYA